MLDYNNKANDKHKKLQIEQEHVKNSKEETIKKNKLTLQKTLTEARLV